MSPTQVHGTKTTVDFRNSGREPSRLDLTQRLERTLARYNASQNVFKRWLFEIISLTISAACIGTIIAICVYSKDKPLRDWPLALTLNNVLSKIASAALILPISEAIGQLKWTWFSGSHSKEMIDFEIFDKASRGAWGSFLLLFRTKGQSLAALGAILTLLLLATDTFFQQLMDLPERWELDGVGEIPRVIRYEGDNGNIYDDGMPVNLDDINLRQATLQAFYYNGSQPILFGNGTRPDIPLSCPSSRCEWDAYETLGLCSECTDISEVLTYACLTTKLDWISSVYFNASTQPTGRSCGFWLNATSDAPMLMSGYRIDETNSSSRPGDALLMRSLPLTAAIVSIDPFIPSPRYGGSIKFRDVYFPVLDAIIVSAVNGDPESVYRGDRPIAQECMLSYCVKTIQSSYELGSYVETVTDKFLNTTWKQQKYPWDIYQLHSRGEDIIFTTFKDNITLVPPSSNDTQYGVSNETFSRTQFLFNEIFPSSMTTDNSTELKWWRVRLPSWGLNQLRPVTDDSPCPLLAPSNVSTIMEKLATSMTNVIRSHKSTEFVKGRAYSQTTFIAVHWEWLTFPLALLCLSAVFLAATIHKTSSGMHSEMEVWKTSAMPTLIYSMPKDVSEKLSYPDNRGKASKTEVTKAKIQLLPGKGWRFSGQTPLPKKASDSSHHHAPPGWI